MVERTGTSLNKYRIIFQRYNAHFDYIKIFSQLNQTHDDGLSCSFLMHDPCRGQTVTSVLFLFASSYIWVTAHLRQLVVTGNSLGQNIINLYLIKMTYASKTMASFQDGTPLLPAMPCSNLVLAYQKFTKDNHL